MQEILNKIDLVQQALQVGHIYCSEDELRQLLKAPICNNYSDQSFKSSSIYALHTHNDSVSNLNPILLDEDLSVTGSEIS